jgi:hypothetical protein
VVEFEVKIGNTRMIALEVGMKGARSRGILVRDAFHLFFQALVKRNLERRCQVKLIVMAKKMCTLTFPCSPSSSDGSSLKPMTARYVDSKEPGPELGPAAG